MHPNKLSCLSFSSPCVSAPTRRQSLSFLEALFLPGWLILLQHNFSHGRISKAYYTSHTVFGRKNGLTRCASALLSIRNRCSQLSCGESPFPTAPGNRESLSPNYCRTRLFSSISAFTEVPYRHPQTTVMSSSITI